MRQQTTSSATSKPADILALVSRLMGHYWLATEPEPVRRHCRQASATISDLNSIRSSSQSSSCARRTGSGSVANQ